MLIYLDLAIQRRVMPLFHYALRPGGYLMLGPSETIGTFGELFAPVDPENKIFAKKVTAIRAQLRLRLASPGTRGVAEPADEAAGPHRAGASRSYRCSGRSTGCCSRGSPRAGVVIDEEMRIVQFRGQTGPYLAPAPGWPASTC